MLGKGGIKERLGERGRRERGNGTENKRERGKLDGHGRGRDQKRGGRKSGRKRGNEQEGGLKRVPPSSDRPKELREKVWRVNGNDLQRGCGGRSRSRRE